MSEGISLSVVLATIEPWPDLANCLAVLEPQVAAVGGEIIVGDGHGAQVWSGRIRIHAGHVELGTSLRTLELTSRVILSSP